MFCGHPHSLHLLQKLQEQSLFAEMEQEHEQVSTVNGKVGFCCGDGAGFAGPTERMDVSTFFTLFYRELCWCSSYICEMSMVYVQQRSVEPNMKDVNYKSQNSQRNITPNRQANQSEFHIVSSLFGMNLSHTVVQLAQCHFCIGVVCRARRGAGLVIGS